MTKHLLRFEAKFWSKTETGFSRVYPVLIALTGLTLSSCGGGGGGGASPTPEPEAVVVSVANGQVLRPTSGVRTVDFVVTMSKPVVKNVEVIFSTATTSKDGLAGRISTGSAKGELACSVAGGDYESLNAVRLAIPVGASTATQTVVVCGSGVFQANETFKINWTSSGGQLGSAIGTIVNVVPGGLNGGGSRTTLTGASFGRDTNSLTNDGADGALGFSFEKRSANGVPSVAADKSDWKCTYDRISGLTWQRVTSTVRSFDSASSYVTAVNAAADCGYSDWRLPIVSELLSIMDTSRLSDTAPNADRDGSLDLMTGAFWSGESTSFAINNAWLISADNMGAVSFAAKVESNRVRLVRGVSNANACEDVSRYVDYTDGTVEDSKTGLMWKKCPEGLSGDTCSEGVSTVFDNLDSVNLDKKLTSRLTAVNGSASLGLGYSDWRVPTRNELESLVNRNCKDPVGNVGISTTKFPKTGAFSYVSVTSDASIPGQLWYVNFADGTVGVGAQSASRRLRLVRGGQ
jgi:hypothetical protein